MASYDYRCRTCDSRFEVRRPIAAQAAAVACPAGHADTTRVFTAVAVTGTSVAATPAPSAAGGCCGGGCCG